MNVSKYAHFYLYTKGHYQWGDRQSDLKKLVANYAGVELEHVTTVAVIHLLTDVVMDAIQHLGDGDPEILLREILSHYQAEKTYRAIFKTPEESYEDFLISVYLNILALSRVLDGDRKLINLGQPDPSVLPLKRTEPQGG